VRPFLKHAEDSSARYAFERREFARKLQKNNKLSVVYAIVFSSTVLGRRNERVHIVANLIEVVEGRRKGNRATKFLDKRLWEK